MELRILPILVIYILSNGCISDKTCSDQDRSCSPKATLMSLLVSAPDGIYMYATNTSYSGKLTVLGPGTLDSSLNFICGQQRIFSNIIDTKCSKYAPLVSTPLVSASSLNVLYADLPTTGVPIRGPFGTIIAQDYSNLFFLDLEVTLEAAGLGNQTYWSFGDGNGGAAADTCSNGEDDGSLSTLGATGSTVVKNQASWFSTNIYSCSNMLKVLCLCYVPTSGGG
ncbi:hypothetical protein LEP1GSC185_2173 [Leptospira licerasiae serovar Varillal str. VAR 010]|uniref:DUF1554 domain-containing protein n=2 Tax=Leptospira licerasiae TaxID=447106 RepID=A0ABN0H4C0_9LEPT|nr:hypothetical protein LEP1GSC185_2173 [Leptospira licerasiae serovar Varillal str. VAR 010]EJZ40388.1 hypothetical protein LEP1GSC178_1444 [Leptospira licerasiae str. MMD4847]